MGRLHLACALVALAMLAPGAASDAAGYSHPANVGVHQPFGAPVGRELHTLEFRTTHAFTEFDVQARDQLRGPVWMTVCLRLSGGCIGYAEGDDRITLAAPPGMSYSSSVIALVRVYTLHAWADGEFSVGTWGGVRAQFNPEEMTRDVVPYAAVGYGGPVSVAARCGDIIGAACATAPGAASRVRVTVNDDVVPLASFQVCAFSGTTQLYCQPGSGTTLAPGVPAGARIDVRVFNSIHNTLTGVKGHAIIEYQT